MTTVEIKCSLQAVVMKEATRDQNGVQLIAGLSGLPSE